MQGGVATWIPSVNFPPLVLWDRGHMFHQPGVVNQKAFMAFPNRPPYAVLNWHHHYDLEIAPGADPKHIALAIDGARELSTDADGNLRIVSDSGEVVTQLRPTVFQTKAGVRTEIECRYRVDGRTVRLSVGPFTTADDINAAVTALREIASSM